VCHNKRLKGDHAKCGIRFLGCVWINGKIVKKMKGKIMKVCE